MTFAETAKDLRIRAPQIKPEANQFSLLQTLL